MIVEVSFEVDANGNGQVSSNVRIESADALELMFLPLRSEQQRNMVRSLLTADRLTRFHFNETRLEADGSGGLLVGAPGFRGGSERVVIPAVLVDWLLSDWEQFLESLQPVDRTYVVADLDYVDIADEAG